MNILLVHDFQKNGEEVKYNAVNYYRMQKPMEVLHRLYPEFDYITVNSIDAAEAILDQTDLVLFSRVIPEGSAEKLNKLGIPFGLDLDDYWYLNEGHILTEHYAINKITDLIIRSIKEAHFVTCTTEVLATHIRPLNPNVFIIENGIDEEDDYWQPEKDKSDRVRFGFTQGETHIHDLNLVAADVARSFSDIKFYHNAQVVLAGFRVLTDIQKSPQSTRLRQGSVQVGYERMLTNDLKVLKHYPNYVQALKTLQDFDGSKMPYRRIASLDVQKFGMVYEMMDVVVAPLQNNLFNNCKSNIKMLEAGFKNCAVMVSGISPYIPLANRYNSYNLNERNFYEWQRYILNNPSDLEDRTAQLAEDVKSYSLNVLSKKRKEIYESSKRLLV